jgi:hypothetical protein
VVERVTGIEPAFSAWEADQRGSLTSPHVANPLVTALRLVRH